MILSDDIRSTVWPTLKEFMLKQNPNAFHVQLLQECGVCINVSVNSSHYFLCVWGEGIAMYPCLPMFFNTCKKIVM